MTDFALVLNAGSSSLKFCVYASNGQWSLDAQGSITGIGTSPKFAVKSVGEAGLANTEHPLPPAVRDGRAALDILAGWLHDHYGSAPIVAVGHRVVHGGAHYSKPCLVTPKVIEDLRALIPLAPLHQPFNVGAIEAVAERLPGVPQVACFDTAFHRTQPAVAQLVALPLDIRSGGVQRYGFHGLSYEYIASVFPTIAPVVADGRVIVAHLGSGASLCALRNRQSIDCTLGFTALDGLCMGTRPGSTDPGVVLHMFQTLGMTAKEVETILYKKSGLLGISGISSDMRDLETSSDPGARQAIDYFVYHASKHVGSLAGVLGGLDALVFTAGIGEHSALIRRRICEASSWLGIEIDEEANSHGGERISTARSRVGVWVIPTNEELMIARHMGDLLGLRQTAAAAARSH